MYRITRTRARPSHTLLALVRYAATSTSTVLPLPYFSNTCITRGNNYSHQRYISSSASRSASAAAAASAPSPSPSPLPPPPFTPSSSSSPILSLDDLLSRYFLSPSPSPSLLQSLSDHLYAPIYILLARHRTENDFTTHIVDRSLINSTILKKLEEIRKNQDEYLEYIKGQEFISAVTKEIIKTIVDREKEEKKLQDTLNTLGGDMRNNNNNNNNINNNRKNNKNINLTATNSSADSGLSTHQSQANQSREQLAIALQSLLSFNQIDSNNNIDSIANLFIANDATGSGPGNYNISDSQYTEEDSLRSLVRSQLDDPELYNAGINNSKAQYNSKKSHKEKKHKKHTNNNNESVRTDTPSESSSSAEDHLEATHSLLDNLDPEVLREVLHNASESDYRIFGEELLLEAQSLRQAVDKYEIMSQSLVSMQRGSTLKPAQKMLLNWYSPLVEAINKEIACVKSSMPGKGRNSYGPYLLTIPPSQLACITITELLNLCLQSGPGNGVKFLKTALTLGTAVNNEAKMSFIKNNKMKMKRLVASFSPADKVNLSASIAKKLRNAKENAWPDSDRVKVGACLIRLLVQSAFVPSFCTGMHNNKNNKNKKNKNLSNNNDNTGNSDADGSADEEGNCSSIPAFRHELHQELLPVFRSQGYIHCHDYVSDTIFKEITLLEALQPKVLPMIMPPRKWSSFDSGGYLSINSRVMRLQGSHQQQQAVRCAEIPQVYRALNYLSSIPWRINKTVYNVVLELIKEGGGVADLPTQADVPLPPLPSFTLKSNPSGFIKYQRELQRAKQINANLHSMRCDCRYKLQIAEKFKDRVIYFPFNIDFRGRAYPIPPHLNHLGNDMSRGLLLFSNKKPLGKNGLKWLKIHAANLFAGGVDKFSFEGRIQWAVDNMELIRQTAVDPLCSGVHRDKQRWWLQAEAPFQFLSTCEDIHGALSSPDPEQYLSRVPVHQDGSCNGLQHYAALGRDLEGGSSVNLTPSDKPQDVYMGVCNRVSNRLAVDAQKNGHPLAKILCGKVNRKIVKQTVMTSVYGVTYIGARNQIKNRLLERDDIEWPAQNKENTINQAAMYLAKVTLNELYEAFAGARRIQDWLGNAANQITRVGRQPVQWLTPLNLPVIQPYRRTSSFVVQTVMQSVSMVDNSDLLPVSGMRQKSAFPPNFIHSLDASHMLLTALRCETEGITFSAVHDSYWTHACDMERMNIALREEFIGMYKEPILENLREEWNIRFPEIVFDEVPERGQLNIDLIAKSTYFFS